MHSVVMHGHFYQPPREDPWRDDVDAEVTAAPFNDWNQRIAHECYLPLVNARVLDTAGRPDRTINLYEWMSFDVGPTLMRWLDRHMPDIPRAMIGADRSSALRLAGHGNAIASPYHHVILPLASRRDKVTEVRWGLADFRRRFGRDAEGFWLPEAAADEETLVVLAEEGVRFTIVAPRQLERPGARGEPLRFTAAGGRDVALFTYDGKLASDIAFGQLLHDGYAIASRLAPVADAGVVRTRRLAAFAVDGETFGHHHKFGEMALARAVDVLTKRRDVRIENYASVLARARPRRVARLVSPSSWSCVHGVERWRADCGCRMDPGTSQAWRKPLREALDWLAVELDARFEASGRRCFAAPWEVRDAFGEVAALDPAARLAFARAHALPGVAAEPALRLLDAACARLGMFGSCAWFFDDVARRETILMLRLAAFAIDTLGDGAIERSLIERLETAPGNDPTEGNGAAVYRSHVLPRRVVR